MLTREQQEFLMRAALEEAALGMANGEVPIGSVLARENPLVIVARGHNQVNRWQSKIAHAEIIAFQNAFQKEGRKAAFPLDAEDIILVSTLEPCIMCLGAAIEAGVQTVLFGLQAPADNGTTRIRLPESPESRMPDITGDILKEESRRLFQIWLQDHENTPQAVFVKQLLSLT